MVNTHGKFCNLKQSRHAKSVCQSTADVTYNSRASGWRFVAIGLDAKVSTATATGVIMGASVAEVTGPLASHSWYGTDAAAVSLNMISAQLGVSGDSITRGVSDLTAVGCKAQAGASRGKSVGAWGADASPTEGPGTGNTNSDTTNGGIGSAAIPSCD
jgi:hypothetical protein